MKTATLVGIMAFTPASLAEAQNNPLRYGMPYEEVEDHPNCNGPAEVALKALIDIADHNMDRGRDACFVTVRRGTEWQDKEIDCEDARSGQSVNQPQEPSLTLDVTGEIAICMSLAGLTLLESDLVAKLDNGDQETSFPLDVTLGPQGVGFHMRPEEPFAVMTYKNRPNRPAYTFDMEIGCLRVERESTSRINQSSRSTRPIHSLRINLAPYPLGNPTPDIVPSSRSGPGYSSINCHALGR